LPIRRRLLAIVDDWEKLERYEERLSPHFEVHCAPFGETGIEMAIEIQPDLIIVDLEFENMTESELRERLSAHPRLTKVPVHRYDEVLALIDSGTAEERDSR